ncbi:hypothetical protein [uncultured Roseobacter sp.]|uniref:hypothetical protein n=1 Tax=uncultured Roseobacter sp. TaxID=114847 RepID=UPI0026217D6F|nr:hypothetical protein [uncultured Roseobacter sp.]
MKQVIAINATRNMPTSNPVAQGALASVTAMQPENRLGNELKFETGVCSVL